MCDPLEQYLTASCLPEIVGQAKKEILSFFKKILKEEKLIFNVLHAIVILLRFRDVK